MHLTGEKYTIQRQQRIFEQVANQIINYIKNNNLKPGTRLPAERKLCQLLGVSRSSIRESIKILELFGYITARQGEGTFVQSAPLFTIPGHLLHCQMNENDLDAYYSVFIMSSMKIVLNSLKKQIDLDHGLMQVEWDVKKHCTHVFFNSFINWIQYLIENNEKIPFADLWSTTLSFLLEHNYFNQTLDLSTPNIHSLISAYHSKHLYEIINLFEQFDK